MSEPVATLRIYNATITLTETQVRAAAEQMRLQCVRLQCVPVAPPPVPPVLRKHLAGGEYFRYVNKLREGRVCFVVRTGNGYSETLQNGDLYLNRATGDSPVTRCTSFAG